MLANTTYTLKHDWTNHSIEQLNCSELKAALLKDYGVEVRYYESDDWRVKKSVLLERAYRIRDLLKAKYDDEQALARARAQQLLHNERSDEKVVTGLRAIADAFKATYDGAKETIAKFQKKVAEANVESNGICSELEWHADDVFLAYSTMDQVINHERYYRGQADGTAETQHTLAEMKQHLHEAVERRMSDMLRVSLSQSTNPIANVRAMAELKAKGQFTSMLKNLQHYFDEIVTSDAGVARYISYCL